MLKHSLLYFPPNSRGIVGWLAEINAGLCLDTCATTGLKKSTYQVERSTPRSSCALRRSLRSESVLRVVCVLKDPKLGLIFKQLGRISKSK